MAGQNYVAGLLWMVATSFFFVCVAGIVHYLGPGVPFIEAGFIRYAFGIVLLAPTLRRLIGRRPRGFVLRLSIARGITQGIAFMLWFYAMARVPVADVTAIGYTAPIFVTIGAALFLGERVRARRIGAVLIGFVGVLIILRPGFESVSFGQLAQLCAAPLFAASFLMAKKLTDTEDPAMIVGLLAIFSTLTLLPGAILQWRTPTIEELTWLFVVAVFATIGQYCMMRAFKAAPITVTQPASYMQLVFAATLGILVFNEPPDMYVFIGAGIIVAAATYIGSRELRASNRN